MEKTASEIQKERIREIEAQADSLLEKCNVLTLASINEDGFPRICALSKLYAEGFREIYFISSKRSQINGKITHFERNPKASICYYDGNDSVTLIGEVSFVCERAEQEKLWKEEHRRFFSKGIDDPKIRFIRFKTLEATFWIGGKFRTVKYKK